MKRAFTLVEILMVVAIIGILAALAIPLFQDNTNKAKESTAKDNLRLLRNAIEIYAAKNNDIPPGYLNNDPTDQAGPVMFYRHLVVVGNYLSDKPKNPFNDKFRVKVINTGEDFPAGPVETDTCGWIYQPSTKTIKLNWNGTDSEGIAYFNY